MKDYIEVKGARVNNLKNVSVRIPHNRLVVLTGVSGSGKSSLAFDTLYAEGQRRYVESLSSYARQFLGRMAKPEVDFIEGLPPAIAIEQRVVARNPRSTVGTSTEIYEYMRLLYATIGRTYSPVSGQEVRRHTAEDVVRTVLSHEAGTRYVVLAPLRVAQGRTLRRQLEMEMQEGYARIYTEGDFARIDDYMETLSEEDDGKDKTLYLVIDRGSVDEGKDAIARLTDSAETAFYEGDGACRLLFIPSQEAFDFSTRFEADGITFEQPTDNLFSFNSPLGACPTCEGFGSVIGIDERLVIPNTSLSVYEGCVQCWHGEKMGQWLTEFCRRAKADNYPIFKPYHDLTQEERKAAYACDVTYGTNNEMGFDYLRDNMALYKEDMVQRGHAFAIVDEVDSILIDEARTPLIISGQGDESTDLYRQAENFAARLKCKAYASIDDKEEEDEDLDADYVVDEKARTATLTARGIAKAEAAFGLENLADIENATLVHHIDQAIRAHGIMKRDIDYVVKDGEIIVDVYLMVRYGYVIPETARKVQDSVSAAVSGMTGYNVHAVNVHVGGISFN